MLRRILIGIAVTGMLLIAPFGCSDAAEPSEEARPLRMVCEADFPPYNFRTVSKRIDGIEIALMDVVAHCLGRELRVEAARFEDLVPMLNEGKADVAGSGMAATRERLDRMLFSDPYMTGSQMLLVRENSAVHTFEDLKGLRVGVEHGTTGEQMLFEAKCRIIAYTRNVLAMKALCDGEVEAVISDRRPAELFMRRHAGLRLCGKSLLTENYVFVLARGNDRLRNQINAVLRAMYAAGIQQRIVARYEASMLRSENVEELWTDPFDAAAAAKELQENRRLRAALKEAAAVSP